MDVPDMVGERLGDERATTRVNVGNDDRVYVAATRTLVYRAGGFLSSASIEEFTHDIDAFDVSSGRRQATFAFTQGEDVRGFTVPEERVETLLTAILSAILTTTAVIAPEETVLDTYCFSERTVIVTDARVLVHGGETVWSPQYREYAHTDIEDVRFEQGASTPIVLVIDGERRRIETPANQARAVYHTLERAIARASPTASQHAGERTVASDEQSHDPDRTSAWKHDSGSESDRSSTPDAPTESNGPRSAEATRSESAGRTDGAGESRANTVEDADAIGDAETTEPDPTATASNRPTPGDTAMDDRKGEGSIQSIGD